MDSYVLNKLNFQIIGLLDCFTPQSTLDQFADVYMVRFVGRKQLRYQTSYTQVTHLMGADLNNIIKTQKLSDDHVQFLIYQIIRGMKYYSLLIISELYIL